ncbi:Uncharacterised protein [Escherichia coli]|nr:Uncharacterised protein [Escherichia coli]CAD6142946.1 Uncharacterised protein [Escherichia coli]
MAIRTILLKCTKSSGDAFTVGQYYKAHIRKDGNIVCGRDGDYSLTADQKHISENGEFWFVVS